MLKAKDLTKAKGGNKVSRNSNSQCHVTINEQVLADWDKISPRNKRERYGVLLGEYKKRQGGYHVHVCQWIEARSINTQEEDRPFTDKTWEQINRIKDSKYPRFHIVGWFHTHPDFGVYLTPGEVAFHEEHFAEEWQIAVILDPTYQDLGVFAWQDNKVKSIPFQRNSLASQQLAVTDERGVSARQLRWWQAALFMVLGVLAGYVSADLLAPEEQNEPISVAQEIGSLLQEEQVYSRIQRLVEEQVAVEVREMREELGEIGSRLESRLDEVIEAQAQPVMAVTPPPVEEVESSESTLESLYDENGYVWTWHYVSQGETLTRLLRSRGIPIEELPLVVQRNEIEQADRIRVGQRMMLPSLIAE